MVIEVSPLIHIEIVVRDAQKAYEYLNRIFGAKKVEEEYAEYLSNPALKIIHVQLGNVILQFCEPLNEQIQSLWADHLREKGPGVHNLTFNVKDVKEAAKAFKQEGIPMLAKFRLEYKSMADEKIIRSKVPPVHMTGGEEIFGFRFELVEDQFIEGKTPEGYKIKPSYDLQRD